MDSGHLQKLSVNMQLPLINDILISAQNSTGTPNNAWDVFAPASKTYAANAWTPSPVADIGFKGQPAEDGINQVENRDMFDGMNMTTNQRSIAKGYSDGFLTAKVFAMHNGSKLGFVGQYIEDSIWALGPTVVAPGTEGTYRQWFVSGLNDGEAIVLQSLNS